MITSITNVNTKTASSQEVTATKHLTSINRPPCDDCPGRAHPMCCTNTLSCEQLDERIAAQHVVEAKQRGIPLWMLRGFPALSNEPDEDDPIDFL